MIAPRLPLDETSRLAALQSLGMLDTAPEDRFDLIVEYCRSRFAVPIAAITLIESERLWIKASTGLGVRETGRDVSFCGHTILDEAILEVSDTSADPRFADNPLVVGDLRIGFYAGCPLTLGSGHRVGTLCLLDRRARTLSTEERFDLRELAQVAVMELEAVDLASRILAHEACLAAMRRRRPDIPRFQ
jgi:GAF domain-containing protein